MEYETPKELLTRLKLGREEAMQRLLTTLILHAPYPKWNTRYKPSKSGMTWLRALYELSFGNGWDGDDLIFVDEFELRGRGEDENSGAPDYVVLWPNRVWVIELKSESGSHRTGQLPLYLELAHHHYPDALIDITYVTPPLSKPAPACESWARYAHVTWQQTIPSIRSAWRVPSSLPQGEVIDGLCEAIDLLHLTPMEWRAHVTGRSAPPEPVLNSIDLGLAAAHDTAIDGVQRAADVRFDSLDELLEYRSELRIRISGEPANSPVRQVRPWVWRAESSGGQPLSELGRTEGYEVRLSRYQTPA